MFPNENRREFQRGIDTEVSKVKRFEERLNLRKQTREGYLSKRRKALNETVEKRNDDKLEDNRFSTTAEEVKVKGPPIPSWVRLENLETFANQVKSANIEEMFKGAQAIRQLLSVEDKPPIEQVFKSGVVPNLIKILFKKVQCENIREKTPEELQKCKLQFEAAWALTNIASGDREFTRKLVEIGCIEGFVELLKNSVDMETTDQVIWGLGNIAGDSPELRDKVSHSGVLDYILKHLNDFPEQMKRNAVWTLSNFCRGKPSPDWKTIAQILNPLTELLRNTSDCDTTVDILWAISFISEDRDEGIDEHGKPRGRPFNLPESFQIDAVIQTGVVPLVITFLKRAAHLREKAQSVIRNLSERAAQEGKQLEVPVEIRQKLATSDFLTAPCVRIIGNIVSGTDEQTAEVVRAGFFNVIEMCVDHPIRNIKKEVCWALSNVIAGTKEQLDLFFQRPNLVKKIVDLCETQGDINIRKEACWCLSNAVCHASSTQLKILLDAGFIAAMVRLMDCKIDKVILIAMDALRTCFDLYSKNFNIENVAMHPLVAKMEELGGLNLLEEIQGTQDSTECCNAAADFVTKYWPMGDDTFADNDNDNDNGYDRYADNAFNDNFSEPISKNDNELYQF